MSLDTPVAFLIFNRPDMTERVFAAIAQARPTTLLVVGDGPRADVPGDRELVAATRKIVDRVDWPCEVLRNFSAANLGCKQRVASGLTWVFDTVDEAIVLEDDCLPNPSFFPFCSELLARYRDDDRIAVISGDNFQGGHSWTRDSYYFSKYCHIWGWASWRRVWQQYDPQMRDWPAFKAAGGLQSIADSRVEEEFWDWVLTRQYNGEIDSWDFPLQFHCWSQSGMVVLPDVNLVSNIGFHDKATRTRDRNSPLANLPTTSLDHIDHPPFIARHKQADTSTFWNVFHHPKGLQKLTMKLRQLVQRDRPTWQAA